MTRLTDEQIAELERALLEALPEGRPTKVIGALWRIANLAPALVTEVRALRASRAAPEGRDTDALREARRALTALYLMVPEDVARDVGAKVEAALSAVSVPGDAIGGGK